MIAHVSGELTLVEADHVVIDVGGVGYKVYAPLSVI
ncbi:MAG TPA: OB-fold domain-containing protein, partial [Armatimonadota bacterium]|nr:OB-fold domain-containing protein [Armatimonadota bacterium]